MGLFGSDGVLSGWFGGGDNGDILGIPGLNDANIFDGDTPLLDQAATLPGPIGQTAGLIAGGASILGQAATSIANNIGNGTTEDNPTGIPPVVSTYTSTAACGLDCYAQCRDTDLKKDIVCKELNKKYLEQMKAMGCTGTSCSYKSKAKTCAKRRRKKSVCKTITLRSGGSVVSGMKSKASSCGCR
jgi:hypothetical protein